MVDERTPVTLITGFLGSGKTTLLNSWLRSPDLAKAVVIVNEFGEVGIDHELIASSNDNTIELSTGCLCCTVKGDLVDTLRELVVSREKGEISAFSSVVIETTGLADPAPVIQAIMTYPVARLFRLDRVVTTVDTVNGAVTLANHPESVKQAAVADDIVYTKTDIFSEVSELLTNVIAQLNPGARYHRSSPCNIPMPSDLAAVNIYDLNTKSKDVQAWLNISAHQRSWPQQEEKGVFDQPALHLLKHDISRHSKEISSFVFEFETALHWEHVANWLDALVLGHGPDLLRVKGILNIIGKEKPIVVQTVQSLFHPPFELNSWSEGTKRSSIVFITRNLTRDFVYEVYSTISKRVPVDASGMVI
jgi:G3E family GTPase